MAVHPFRMYNARECDAIVAGLQETIGIWNHQWLPKQSYRVGLRNVEGGRDALLSDLQATDDRAASPAGGVSPDCLVMTSDVEKVARGLLGLPGEASSRPEDFWVSSDPDKQGLDKPGLDDLLETQLVSRFLTDLTERVFGLDPGQQTPLSQITSGKSGIDGRLIRGYGAAVLSIAYDEFTVQLLVGPTLLSKYVQPIPVRKIGGLVPFMETLLEYPVPLRAELGSTVVTIGDLDRLAVGDVVKLDQSLEIAPQLVTRGGEAFVEGRLGSNKGYKALQVY